MEIRQQTLWTEHYNPLSSTYFPFLPYLASSCFWVRLLAHNALGKVHLPLVMRDMRHYVYDSLNRFRIVTFSKKVVEFRDNMPIFVYATVSYITLAFPFLATIIY